MKIQFNKRYLRIGLTAFLVVAASICFYYLIFHGDRFSAQLHALIKVASPVIYGIIFAYLMTPMVNGLESRFLMPFFFANKGKPVSVKQKKWMRVISILLTIYIVGCLIYGFFSILIPNITKSVRSISYQFPYYVQNLMNWSAKFLDDNPDIEKMVFNLFDKYSGEFTSYLNNSIVPQMEMLVKHVSLSMISVLKLLWNFIIGIIISIYVLYSKETFAGQAKKIVFAVFKTSTANQFIKDVRFISNTFIGFISGKIVDSIIIGIICFAGTSIMKMPYALLISVIVGITNIIPFFGPYLGAIPSAILILMVNPVKCVYFIIFILILQQVDGNVIGPKILGQSTGLSGFWVIFSITVFGGLMGIPGMIIGVPFFAVIYAMIRRMTNKLLTKRGLPLETSRYLDVDYIQDNVFIPMDETKNTTFFKLGKKKQDTAKDGKKDSPDEK
ncbi:MAG: AI-2E family transporter [Lachnospiraceae bacterium]|nr:AI-2E family transporter [Lachnospiraceae bacterium]GFI15373.1 putative transport protein YhhT [Lachnospiraceae bacterium]